MMTRRQLLQAFAAASGAVWFSRSVVWAQGALQLTSLADKLTLLSGAGGNIAILTGPEGLLLVDCGVPDAAEAVETKAKSVAPVPITTLLNTHWHFDHVGANVRLGKAGAKIIAHQNTKKRLSVTQHTAFFDRDTPPLAPEGLPKETFTTTGLLKHGGEKLRYQYLPPAHTDGDTTIHFENAGVYHAGDLFFNGLYPFIDYSSAGSIEGMIANANRMLKIVDMKMKIIPGHGPMATKTDLKTYHDMLADVNDKMSKLVSSGKTLEQVQAAEPTKSYDEKWGKQFLKPADFVKMLYQGKTMGRS